MGTSTQTVLDIYVNNHAGVMAHVTGLFSRRAFNVEAILCLPVSGGDTSRIWLLVNNDERLEQMMRQMRKLQDVYEVNAVSAYVEVFLNLSATMNMDIVAANVV